MFGSSLRKSEISSHDLLDSDEGEVLIDKSPIGIGRKSHDYRRRIGNIVHLSILYCAVAALLSVIWISDRHSTTKDPSLLSYSPAREAIEYMIVDFESYFVNKSPYMGFPDDDIDARWESLYSFGVSQIPEYEAELLENKTLPRPGTKDYLIELDVFHQLHCLNDLRKALYPDRYPGKWPYNANGTVNYNSITFMHWDHCIDALRQSLMCHGDISPLPFHINHINDNLVAELVTRHTCRDFGKIQQWARDRQAGDYVIHQDLETN
ncbi:hypothetical protein GQ53DRAFT_838034 [Thozetella sp. PMI_491]|nr:hypothetical protein GQ53DRAFT_838034 [Thozetella sp. PMI_491]